MKKESQEEMERKYLQALKDLKNLLSYTSMVSISKFTLQNNLNVGFGKVITEGGIVKREGKGRSTRNHWNTNVEPNLQMAKKVMSELTKINEKQRLDRNKSVTKTQKTSNRSRTASERFDIYRNVLIELKETATNGRELSTMKFTANRGINKNFILYCVELGLLSKRKLNKSNSWVYKWIAGDVTDDMVTSIRDIQSAKHTISKVDVSTCKTVTTSFLWGLYKKVSIV